MASLDDGACAKPEAADCIHALSDVQGLAAEQRLSALSELWLNQAQTLPKTSPDTTQQVASDAAIRA